MADNSFCGLFGGLIGIALAAYFVSFGTSWALVDVDYAPSPAEEWIWVGGLTSTSINFKMRLPALFEATLVALENSEPTSVDFDNLFSLLIGTHENVIAEYQAQQLKNNNNGSNTVIIGETTTSNGTVMAEILIPNIYLTKAWAEKVLGVTIDNLQPQTQYYYAVVQVAALQTTSPTEPVFQGKFRTPAPEGTRFDFNITASGCAWTGSQHSVFERIQQENSLFFLHMGDLHYEDIHTNDLTRRINAIGTVHKSKTQAALYQSTAFVGIWDDHDWLGNNADGIEEEPGARDTALISYQIAYPHYPLPALLTSPNYNKTLENQDRNLTTQPTFLDPVPVYQAFTIGTVRFIISDLRSEATDTLIQSPEQTAWLKQELNQAANYDFVVWVSSRPWLEKTTPGEDSWAGFSQERLELSNFISNTVGTEDGPQNLLVISSDAHMVAFDNGTNTYYGPSTRETVRSFPYLVSGPLDRLGSSKGGPFTDGCHAYDAERTHQFSTISFQFGDGSDSADKCIEIRSYRQIDFKKNPDAAYEILSRRICNNIFVDAVTTEEERVGTCYIESLWDVNDSLAVAASAISLVTIIATWLLLHFSDATTLGDCCCKSIIVSLLVVVSYFAILSVGFGTSVLRGVQQYSVTPIIILNLLTAIFFLGYLIAWWSCCTHTHKRRLDDNDPGFTDVEPDLNIQSADLVMNNHQDSKGNDVAPLPHMALPPDGVH